MSDDISDGQINMPPQPKSGFEAFKGTPLAIIIGGALAVAFTILLFYSGMYASCCGIGFFLVALVLYYIPKLFGTKKLYQFLVIGVVFFLVVTAFGTLVVSKDLVNRESVESGDNMGSGWSYIQFKTDDNEIWIDCSKEVKEDQAPVLIILQVDKLCYTKIVAGSNEKKIKGTLVEETEKTYKFSDPEFTFEKGKLYEIVFGVYSLKEGKIDEYVSNSNSNAQLFRGMASDDDIQKIALNGNSYWVGICAACYFILVVLMHFMNAYLDKTRARMEAEGRLYPQGYGRCKECGTIVLPGETCCRKCGAYVDIPDELRVKKVESFQCSECGAEVPGDSNCCPRCGAKFDEDDETVVVKDDKKAETIDVQNTATEEQKPETQEPAQEQKSEEQKKE